MLKLDITIFDQRVCDIDEIGKALAKIMPEVEKQKLSDIAFLTRNIFSFSGSLLTSDNEDIGYWHIEEEEFINW